MPVLATTPAKARRTILVVGDSLSAEYGLRRGSGWVAMLAGRLDGRFEVVNASISGETTAGGAARIEAVLAEQAPEVLVLELGANDGLRGLPERHRPAFVVIALGGNDALRGLDLAATRGNLDAMLSATRAAGAVPVLAGIQVPPNYGKRYTSEFASIFPDLARAHDAALVPFILAGVAERIDLFQADRIHPTEAAQPMLLDNVWRVLGTLIAGKPSRS